MSASTSTRRNRQENTESAAPVAPSTDTSETALATADTARTVTVEIANLQVTLPLKFAAGHVLTENQAKVLDAAYQRQFTNNQNAIAKARAEKLAKATTDADKAAAQPLTADAIAALYTDYEPNVGGGPRMGSMEKMRMDAAWRAWVKLVTEHNESVKIGGEPVIAKAGSKPVAIQSAPRKGKDMSEDAHKAAVEAFTTARDAFKAKMLTLPAYADRIQAELDAIMAERGASKTETAVEAVTASDDLI